MTSYLQASPQTEISTRICQQGGRRAHVIRSRHVPTGRCFGRALHGPAFGGIANRRLDAGRATGRSLSHLASLGVLAARADSYQFLVSYISSAPCLLLSLAAGRGE